MGWGRHSPCGAAPETSVVRTVSNVVNTSLGSVHEQAKKPFFTFHFPPFDFFAFLFAFVIVQPVRWVGTIRSQYCSVGEGVGIDQQASLSRARCETQTRDTFNLNLRRNEKPRLRPLFSSSYTMYFFQGSSS